MSEWLLKALSKVFGEEYIPPAEDLALAMERNGELTFENGLVHTTDKQETVSTY